MRAGILRQLVRLMVMLAPVCPVISHPLPAAETAGFSPRDTIRGRVVDEGGQPVPNIRVSEIRGWLLGKEIATVTDDNGEFRIGATQDIGDTQHSSRARRKEIGRAGWPSPRTTI